MFKTCRNCGLQWESGPKLLSDPEVAFVGYQPRESFNSLGLLLFNHDRCHGTMGIWASSFQHLSQQPILAASCSTQSGYSDYCLAAGSATRCPPQCICRFVASLTEIIRQWPKQHEGDTQDVI
jgi:hypothetical protein